MDTEMMIGSAFEAGSEAEETFLKPTDGRDDPQAAGSLAGTVIEAAVAAAKKAFDGWSRTTPAHARAIS